MPSSTPRLGGGDRKQVHKVQGRMTWTPPNFVRCPLGGQPLPQGCRVQQQEVETDRGCGSRGRSVFLADSVGGTGHRNPCFGCRDLERCMPVGMRRGVPSPSPARPPLLLLGSGHLLAGSQVCLGTAPPSGVTETGDAPGGPVLHLDGARPLRWGTHATSALSGHCQVIAQSVRRNER